MAEEMTMAKQMNVNMQLLDLEMRVLARMIEYTCKHFRRVMRDPDLSMFICKEYIDLMI